MFATHLKRRENDMEFTTNHLALAMQSAIREVDGNGVVDSCDCSIGKGSQTAAGAMGICPIVILLDRDTDTRENGYEKQ